jgi:RNA polymerase sigma-70 factor, ECF subfamily
MEQKENINEVLLISEIRNGSIEAFESLYNLYKKKLYYFSYKYLKDHSDTEELVQSVFLSLWEHRKSIDDSQSIKNYIYRSAVNNIYNQFKKRSVHNKYVDYQLQRADHENNPTIDHIYYQDLKKSINAILEELPPQQKNIFYLSRVENLSHQKIADKLNLSVRTIENQIYRVIKRIKKELNL